MNARPAGPGGLAWSTEVLRTAHQNKLIFEYMLIISLSPRAPCFAIITPPPLKLILLHLLYLGGGGL